MVDPYRLNVVDRPLSWRDPSIRGAQTGRPTKTTPVYYDKSMTPEHTGNRKIKTAGRELANFRKYAVWSTPEDPS